MGNGYEAVERGTRETHGACKQSLLLKHAGFFERQGKDEQALHLLAEAHQDGKRRKMYLSEEIDAKLRLLASKLALPEEQLDKKVILTNGESFCKICCSSSP